MSGRVAIIGGGFCGAMTAIHLRRDHPSRTGDIAVIEPRATLGAGLAYGTDDPALRVNVAASRLSPFEEEPDAFDTWLRREGEDVADPGMVAEAGLFPRRGVFGRYVAGLAQQQQQQGAGGIRHVRARAAGAVRNGAGYAIVLEDGITIQADILVLATGHPPAVLPPPLPALAHDRRIVADPWDMAALARIAREGGEVIVLGTGLTGCDVIASLRQRGHRDRIIAVSRRGLLPRPRTAKPVVAYGAFDSSPARHASALLARIRTAVAELDEAGRPWEDVIAALREQAPAVWGSLPLAERARVLRHARSFWDVHRFQCAPQIDKTVSAGRARGDVEVVAGRIAAAAADSTGLQLRIAHRSGIVEERVAGWVVNCTGPGHGRMIDASPLLTGLADAGLIRPDPLGLGIEADAANCAVGADGRATPTLFIAGPPARATEGELMGLPQVTRQPRRVAAAIARL